MASSKKVAGADSSKHAFGTHLPRPIRRVKGMTDAEYRNKVESNLRAVEDPFKPKKTDKARFSSRLEELAKSKVRNADKHISYHQAELNWRKSLRK